MKESQIWSHVLFTNRAFQYSLTGLICMDKLILAPIRLEGLGAYINCPHHTMFYLYTMVLQKTNTFTNFTSEYASISSKN